jgi:hypothetical protein
MVFTKIPDEWRQVILDNDVPITLLPYVFRIELLVKRGWLLWVQHPNNGDALEHIRLAREYYKDRFRSDLGKEKVIFKYFSRIIVDITDDTRKMMPRVKIKFQ